MLEGTLLAELNQQIKDELYSAQLYLAMAAYCYSADQEGFANFLEVQVKEERFHAMKLFHYLNDMGARIKIYGLDEPNNHYQSILDVFEKGYEHEQWVTKRIHLLSELAKAENHQQAVDFLKWYIDEQVEEEETFLGIVNKLKQSDDESALAQLNAELAQRSFKPPHK
ncbi:MAG: ferritin [Carboxydocellales bacterium]